MQGKTYTDVMQEVIKIIDSKNTKQKLNGCEKDTDFFNRQIYPFSPFRINFCTSRTPRLRLFRFGAKNKT